MSGCMDVNSPESAAGGYSVKSRLEELEEVFISFSDLFGHESPFP